MFFFVETSLSTLRVPIFSRASMLTFKAAGFMATSTSGLSPGVNTSRLEKFSWNPETPARVPAGARISAGKSGRVLRSLPASADSLVNCMPATCMPSPESPAKRMTTVSRVSTRLRGLVTPSSIVSTYTAGGGPLQFLPAALSVVVPTLDEAEALPATLAAARQPGVHEVIVVDGGSRDDTRAVACSLADRVLEAPRGRARQMNAGAAAARGDVLLFLHADTRLPAGYAQAVAGALADPAVVGGRFDVRLDAAGLAYRAIGRLISLRSRLTHVATGDQAIFVRRAVFERLGGYPLVPLMEDVALSRAMKRAGRVACLNETVTTSARRWQRHGVARTVLVMWALRAAYYAGVPPARLARIYPDAR